MRRAPAMHGRAFLVRSALVASFFLLSPAVASAEDVLLRVRGAVDRPLELTREDFAAMPRQRIEIPARDDPKVVETWEGVPLIEILRKAGAPVDERLRGRNAAAYVVVKAQDGYRAVYALAEVDPGFSPERRILVADKVDGKPLGGSMGNLRIANQGEGKFARWVRQVVELEVRLAD
jgi:DMSO/TMAO reductase YedYZ molybdopterin-dependent catalytic subunit